MTSQIVLERCQFGDALTEFEFNKADGEAGCGIYAYVPNSNMRSYYSSRGEKCYRLKQLSGSIIDLTSHPLQGLLLEFAEKSVQKLALTMPGYCKPKITNKNIQRYGAIISVFIRQHYPDSAAYIVNHEGPGLPKGKQAVILDISAFAITQILSKEHDVNNEKSLDITCAPDDLKNVSEWMGCDINDLNIEIERQSIEKFRSTIVENLATYGQHPKDRQRTEKIIAALRNGEKQFPIFVENGKPNLVMEGRHRIIAFEEMGLKMIPVAVVSTNKVKPEISSRLRSKRSP